MERRLRDDPRALTAPFPLLPLFGAGLALVLLLKLLLASILDLYSDEVYYWLASTHPALAYSDLPFMTAMLAGLGATLDAGNPLAVRAPFIVLGTLVPFLVYWLAQPVTGRRQALEAAILSLCLPLGGFLGLLAVPDVPLVVLGLLAIGSFERALRLQTWTWWLTTGLFVALGLSTHYRYLLYPVAAVLFLVCVPQARAEWRNPKLWAAMLVAALGLIPVLWFNLNNQLSSASFYLVERHPWEFQASGLLHLFKQAALVTPPLYAVLLLTAWRLWQRSRQGDTRAALLLGFALVNLGVYLLLAPWTDADSTSIHWPLSGYFPLLVYVPQTLRELHNRAGSRWRASTTRRLLLGIPALGFAGTLVALLGVGSQAWQLPLQHVFGSGVLSNKMAGWDEFAAYTHNLLARDFPDGPPVIITDNYYTAAQVEFAGLGRRAYTLDRDKAVRDGRTTQLRLWGRDESALADNAGAAVLYINEDSTLFVPAKHELMAVMCGHVDALRPLAELSLFNGDKRFSYYRGEGLRGATATGERARPCPFPMRAWIDLPQAGAEVSGNMIVAGWAYSEDIGVRSVRVLVDGEPRQAGGYGVMRPDVVAVQEVESDPNVPAVGFHTELDTRQLDNGPHSISVEITNAQGSVLHYGERSVFVNNP
ncbi:MAG: glycosyltransferase family 39 protein [Pseudohongiellaceae bacterium]